MRQVGALVGQIGPDDLSRIRSRLNDLDVSCVVTILVPDYRGGVTPDQPDLSTLSLHSEQTFEGFDLCKRAFDIARSFAGSPRG
jgi:hypothetical protein